MILYHSILYKNNKFKFTCIIAFELILTILSVVTISSFYKEENDMSLMFLIGILQFINIVTYIFFRLTYKEEILVLGKDKINIFITSKKAKNRIFKNKLAQIFLFFMYQIPMGIIMSLVFRLPTQQIGILFINIAVSMLMFYVIGINDIAVINKCRKNYVDKIFSNAFILAVIYFVSLPSYFSLTITIISLALSTIFSIILIMRGKSENDKN